MKYKILKLMTDSYVGNLILDAVDYVDNFIIKTGIRGKSNEEVVMVRGKTRSLVDFMEDKNIKMNKMIEAKVKPKIELNKSEIVVNTKNVNELDNLMQIYEVVGGIMWLHGGSPLDKGTFAWSWEPHKENTCISLREGVVLTYGHKKTKDNALSLQEFYKEQGITSEKLNEINNYFNN